ncbi:MAG: glycosyltransferase N-terminal domain-containing protein [Candidatus Marinimicrobia bacterium]|nr:glycosyltransferase N-terminal domain-containing protein [Candidatus Neomarinimicrobiota bacterium]
MTIFWIFIYNIFIVPPAFIVMQILVLFNAKIKRGITGRKASWNHLKRFRHKYPSNEVFLVHSASLGEFEQAKPVIRGLKAIRSDVLIVASFTSPSGFEHARKMSEVNLMIYLPFDTFFRTRRFIQILKPQKIIFVTYELWPNLIINAKRYHIPTYLMSARIRHNSSKFYPVVSGFFKELYRSLDYIFAISEKDKESVNKLIGSVQIRVLNLGDTRYDQVIERARSRMTARIPVLFQNSFVFIAGSIWPQDARHLMPTIRKILKQYSQSRCIIAPHEPNEFALESFEDQLSGNGISVCRYSKVKQFPVNETIVLIDKIGILAELYHQTNLAFVGGGFRGSVHNVMEPAVAGIPVIFGPDYHNSREAELLVKAGGGFTCADESSLFLLISKLMDNETFYRQASQAARRVILENIGASARTVKEILEND